MNKIITIATNRNFQIGLAIAYFIFFIFFSFKKAKGVDIGSDFHVFWQAGVDFRSGADLYFPKDGAWPFIYPQFAAFLFQVLGLLNLKVAAQLFFLLNVYILIPTCCVLLFRTCKNYGVERNKARLAVALTFILSAQYIWSNLSMFQVNYLLLTITLFGIYYLSKDRPDHAVVFFTMATFVKIIPIFFLFYTLVFYKSIRVFLYSFGVAVLCIVIPALERGFDRTSLDYQQYYEVFLKEFKNGKVITAPMSHTLKGGVLKMFYPETRDKVIDPTNYTLALRLSNVVLLVMFTVLTIVIWKAATVENKLSMQGLASIFVFSHLASGMTWTHHLVTATFSLLPFVLLMNEEKSNRSSKVFFWTLFSVLVFMAIEGSDTTGKFLYQLLRNYDIYVFIPLLPFIYYSYLTFSRIKRTHPVQSPILNI